MKVGDEIFYLYKGKELTGKIEQILPGSNLPGYTYKLYKISVYNKEEDEIIFRIVRERFLIPKLKKLFKII